MVDLSLFVFGQLAHAQASCFQAIRVIELVGGLLLRSASLVSADITICMRRRSIIKCDAVESSDEAEVDA